MLSAESVKMRLKQDSGISFLEFNYMILQAYDFQILNSKYSCKLQIGGQDQWGNIVSGTELIRRNSNSESAAFGLTIPLLMNSQGQKFGKTVAGAVWLDPARTSVFDFYNWRNPTTPRAQAPSLLHQPSL
jgi:tyrosyl-tRNA synthetase